MTHPLAPLLPPLARLLRERAEKVAVTFFEVATRHQVLPLLEQLVADGQLALDAAAHADLQQSLKQNAMRALAATALLARLTALLKSKGVDCLALKGIAVAQVLYGDPAARQVGDLDLLIPPEQLETADRALRAAGLERFIPAGTLSSSQQRLYTALRHEFVYRDPAYDFRVEIHWRLNNCASLRAGSFEELWTRRQTVTLGNAQIPMLGRDDLLLHLCIHGGAEAWPKLKWLCDIALLLQQFAPVELETVLARARQAGLDRLLLAGGALAHELLDASWPPALQAAFGQSGHAIRLRDHARRNLLELRFKPGGGAAFGSALGDFAYRLRLSSRWRYRAECLATDLIIPETVLDPGYARWPFWALGPMAAAKTLVARIARRAAQ